MSATPSTARLSIGALSRASGIPVSTLRTWERRYGCPQADRKPSGHRVYPASSVVRLRRIAAALARGHRAGEVLTASDAALADILSTLPVAADSDALVVPAGGPAVDLSELIETIRRFDARLLARRLGDLWQRLGPLRFCRDCVGPLLVEVGLAWETGRLGVRHEHFASERLADLLRSARLPYEDRATGPLVVLGTLPGEWHGLGVQMIALLLAVNGARGCLLGTDVPLAQMAQVSRDLGAQAVAVSVSRAGEPARVRRQVRSLRAALPRRVELVLGGAGAAPVASAPGVVVLQDLAAFDAWARDLAASTM